MPAKGPSEKPEAGEGRNIVLCCDGTGNEIEENLSNVLKLYRVLVQDERQLVYYDPGIGTLGRTSAWARLKQNARGVFGMATGYGLDDDVTAAYRFLCEHYREGDRVYLFGFSRGAYTVRVLAGFLRLVGLLRPEQANLADYAFTAYKQAADRNAFTIAWRFQRVTGAEEVPVRFMGAWDTVSSVIVPRPDRLYLVPGRRMLPFTATNDNVEVFRQAAAIDERRRMFRLNRWNEPQNYQPNRFDPDSKRPQDISQVWFAGVHADIGGGYPEADSGLAKYPLRWMIDEARAHGLLVNQAMVNHLVLGMPRKGASAKYVEPDPAAPVHRSMTLAWSLIEWIPKRTRWQLWPRRPSLLGWYIPWAEPRLIPEGARIHQSVIDRMAKRPDYRPVNLPKAYETEP